MSSSKKPSNPIQAKPVKKGVPRFDKETLAKMIAEATAPGANMIDVGNKWGVGAQIYSYVAKARQKEQAPPTIPSDLGSYERPSPAGGQYRRAPNESQELQRLREENEQLYKVIGRLTVERDRLLKKN